MEKGTARTLALVLFLDALWGLGHLGHKLEK